MAKKDGKQSVRSRAEWLSRALHTAALKRYGSSRSGQRRQSKGASLNPASKTDWARVDAMRPEDINLSEVPELTAEWFRQAVRWPPRKQQITLRLDPDVIQFFKKNGRRGYQTNINRALRTFVEAAKKHASKPAKKRAS